jgi:two-component system NtrC family sensor kinase
MGGTIAVESQPGKGTRVCVKLPMTVGAGAAPRRAAAPVTRARPGKILIVDDEAPLATALCRLLLGVHDCEHATDSRVALDRLRQEAFDLVLCDLIMPGLNGWELYEALTSERPEYAERFLFITGGAATEHASAFVSKRPRDVLAKPLDIDGLLSEINRRLGPAIQGS